MINFAKLGSTACGDRTVRLSALTSCSLTGPSCVPLASQLSATPVRDLPRSRPGTGFELLATGRRPPWGSPLRAPPSDSIWRMDGRREQPVDPTSSGRLADAVSDANTEVIRFVESCPLEVWGRRTAEEDWTLSMAGCHIALSHLTVGRWVHRVASGLDITESLDDFEKSNATDARYNSDLSQSAVVERLRVYGRALERLVRDLSDEQLATSASFRGRPITAAEVVETIAIGHARGHLAHMASARQTP